MTGKHHDDDPGGYWLGIVIITVMITAILFAVLYEPLAAHFGWPT